MNWRSKALTGIFAAFTAYAIVPADEELLRRILVTIGLCCLAPDSRGEEL